MEHIASNKLQHRIPVASGLVKNCRNKAFWATTEMYKSKLLPSKKLGIYNKKNPLASEILHVAVLWLEMEWSHHKVV